MYILKFLEFLLLFFLHMLLINISVYVSNIFTIYSVSMWILLHRAHSMHTYCIVYGERQTPYIINICIYI